MILDKKRGVKMDLSCPHTRGDDPTQNTVTIRHGLVPIRVGMIPLLALY